MFVFVVFVQVIFSSLSVLQIRRSGLPNRGFAMESTPNIDFSCKSFLMHFGSDCVHLSTASEADFLVFGPWKQT